MKSLLTIILLILLTQANVMYAQDLKSHQWNERILLVISNDENESLFQEQILTLKQKLNELENRKLVVFQITAKGYKTGFSPKDNWIDDPSLFNKFNATKGPFKIVLIGLDGGVKLEQYELLSVEKLFNTIDSMPMRRAELSTTKKG